MSPRHLRAAFLAAAALPLLWAQPASAQYAPGGSEVRKKHHSVPRKKQNDSASRVDWSGLSVDFGVYRPLISRVSITSGTTELGQFNLTGIHLAATAAYLFQEGRFVIGPRVRVAAGWIESMPLDYIIRTNASLTIGGETGIALGRWYAYSFAAGGAAWLTVERQGSPPQANNVVPAYEVGAGVRYALPQGWYAKTEVSYTTLGDHRFAGDYVNPKPSVGLSSGFGFRF